MTTPQTSQEAYDQLSYYTLAHKSPEFIHQYIVDAFAAQTADEHTKPIKVAFALMGLYLHLKKGFTGKEVQLAHMQVGKTKKVWPTFHLPKNRGEITVFDVLATPGGVTRDEAIERWMSDVWESWAASHTQVESWLKTMLPLV